MKKLNAHLIPPTLRIIRFSPSICRTLKKCVLSIGVDTWICFGNFEEMLCVLWNAIFLQQCFFWLFLYWNLIFFWWHMNTTFRLTPQGKQRVLLWCMDDVKIKRLWVQDPVKKKGEILYNLSETVDFES